MNLNNLTKSRHTIIDMIELRGYNLDKYKNFTDTELDLMMENMGKIQYENMPLDMECKHNDSDKSCLIKYVLTKLRVEKYNVLIIDLIEQQIIKDGDDLILIVKDKINNLDSFYSLFDKFYKSNNIFIQIFSINNLLINIKNHVLVPDLRILNDSEKDSIREKYNVETMTQFPLLLNSDPMAKFYGVKHGDLCEITRTSETSGKYISYRYCE